MITRMYPTAPRRGSKLTAHGIAMGIVVSRSVRPERAKALLQIRAVALTGRSLCLQFPMAMPWAISSLPLRGANALLRPLLHPFTVYLTIYSLAPLRGKGRGKGSLRYSLPILHLRHSFLSQYSFFNWIRA